MNQATLKYRFRGKWATMTCREENMDMISHHYYLDGCTSVKVVKIEPIKIGKKVKRDKVMG